MICRASLIATIFCRLPQKRSMKNGTRLKLNSLLVFFDWYWHLCFLCLLRQNFLAADSQKLSSSPQRAHLTFVVRRDKLELAFWLLCSLACILSHRYLQMDCWAAVTVVAIPSQPALLMWPWPYVSTAGLSVLLPHASRNLEFLLHSRHPADLAYFGKLTHLLAVIPSTAMPNHLLRLHGTFLSLKYMPNKIFPASCLSMKSPTRVQWKGL